QSAIYTILDAMVRLIAPILAFTADEIWLAMRHDAGANAGHVMLNDMPEPDPAHTFDAETAERFGLVIALREDVNKALELARSEKILGKPLDARVTLFVSEDARADFEKIAGLPLSTLFIVSDTAVVYGGGEGYESEAFKHVKIKITPCATPKCVRCWAHSARVGEDAGHPELCPRCTAVVSG
ncbi:MAG: class I tRNA ligase family protein, partial [Oscillospiraceae bacterium]|nr:class I tRNA ligase family protein [Oscillospiraceae bacterium]